MVLVILAGDEPVNIETPHGTVHVGPGCCLRIPDFAAPEVAEAVRSYLAEHPELTYGGEPVPPEHKPLKAHRPAKPEKEGDDA